MVHSDDNAALPAIYTTTLASCHLGPKGLQHRHRWEPLAAVWRVDPSNSEHAFCCLMTVLSLLGKMMRDENKHSHASQKHISRRWHTETSNLYLNASFSVLCGVFQTSHDWQSWKPEPRCGWASFSKRRQHMSLQIPRHRATPGQFKS